jgi:hypothetical protein
MGMMGAALVAREAVSALADMARSGVSIDPGARPPARFPDALAATGDPARPNRFDRIMDALNRLPRPLLAFGALAFFAHAMIDPVRFSQGMIGLQEVPEPLWWLLGGVVGFHFGAREAHYFRARSAATAAGAPEMPEDPAGAASEPGSRLRAD